MPDSPRYRFAPSPTGFFHVGEPALLSITGHSRYVRAERLFYELKTLTNLVTALNGPKALLTHCHGWELIHSRHDSKGRTSSRRMQSYILLLL